MITHLTVLGQNPGGGYITFGRIEITWLGEDDTLARDRLMREAEAYDDPGPADEIDLREPQPEEAEQ